MHDQDVGEQHTADEQDDVPRGSGQGALHGSSSTSMITSGEPVTT
ncbi:hypothetical protein Ae168Ps1_1294 [Pseudonocardia sp. Ae168_Ps1]|nr:hypothetical protein Ae150APs1_1291 [Pseudonocardia sp. Ae150A_Ps1]OLL78888.1 hypothetical protein Ae168Ps1_1294 [Pseudonocardia sp. Ae168_Ps1]OLL86973.1 hypothetical protein Ae263Ps1_4028c [Pseudonocardia sp. Ae263_Ps1]OLL92983.1 hypothetical protein Ae356Ps1_2880 [Pseudonocardia sp. Ae356_Ps1]